MERTRFMQAAQRAGVLDRDDERNTYDNLLGRALFNYEKAVYKQEGLEAIPWNPSTRSWIGGFTTIDADVTDARFLDPPATWNVLYAKGPAAWDVSGFVVRVDRDGGTLRADRVKACHRKGVQAVVVDQHPLAGRHVQHGVLIGHRHVVGCQWRIGFQRSRIASPEPAPKRTWEPGELFWWTA